MKCEHTSRAFFAVGSNWDARILRCLRCMKLLPFGPSNDCGAAVGIEMRAAALAAFQSDKRGLDTIDKSEMFGWHLHAGHDVDANIPRNDAEWAGYLAREIAMHGSTA